MTNDEKAWEFGVSEHIKVMMCMEGIESLSNRVGATKDEIVACSNEEIRNRLESHYNDEYSDLLKQSGMNFASHTKDGKTVISIRTTKGFDIFSVATLEDKNKTALYTIPIVGKNVPFRYSNDEQEKIEKLSVLMGDELFNTLKRQINKSMAHYKQIPYGIKTIVSIRMVKKPKKHKNDDTKRTKIDCIETIGNFEIIVKGQSINIIEKLNTYNKKVNKEILNWFREHNKEAIDDYIVYRELICRHYYIYKISK